MYLLLLPLLLSAALAADMAMNIHPAGSYNFNYNTGDEGAHSRSESGSNGVVSGKYSYVDPNGNLRQVSYTAGPDGFKPTGDIGVDKKTAEEAAKMAALAPKAPPAPSALPTAPVWHWPGAPYHGAWQWSTPTLHGAWPGVWNVAPWYGPWQQHHWGKTGYFG